MRSRRQKVFGPGGAVPLDRNAKARIAAYSRAWDRLHRELRRLFPGITDNAQARECARTIAGWKPLRAVKRMPKPPRLRRMR
jgi:hypothetical protein